MDGASQDAVSLSGTLGAEGCDDTPAPPPALLFRCPHCMTRSPVAAGTRATDLSCPSCGMKASLAGTRNAADNTLDFAALAVPEAVAGQTLGRFQLLEQLGQGGFGTVWKARDPQLDRVVALKVPHRGRLGAEEFEKVLREARAAAQLRHPNIVSVHEIEVENERLYIVSEFVEGQPLDKWLADRRPGHREAAELCAKIAAGLEHAHQLGVIHRDLKPGNIMVDCRGEPHIMDFGLAKRTSGEMTMTIEGQILGTPAYMSPEQAKGHGHAADPRSDVYSLGVILFELLTHERPFRGNLQMLLKQVIEDEPPSPRKFDSRVPRDLETVCLKCMQKEPLRRYPSAKAVEDELRRYLAGEPIAARPVGRIERAARWCRRKPLVAGLSATAILCLVFGLAASTVGYLRASRALRDTRAAQAQTRQAVDDLFTRVSEDVLLNQPGMQRLRADLLARARDYYQQFLDQSAGDDTLRDDVALAHYRLGVLTDDIGSAAEAQASYEQAKAMQRTLVQAEPNNVERLKALGDTLNALGRAHDKQRQLDQGLEDYWAAIDVRNQLVAAAPESHDFKRALANTYMNIGLAEKPRDPARACEYLEQAQAIRLAIPPPGPNDPKLRRDLAKGDHNLAKVFQGLAITAAKKDKDAVKAGEWLKKARGAIADARRRFGQLADEEPRDLEVRQQFAICHRVEADIICQGCDTAATRSEDAQLPATIAPRPEREEALVLYRKSRDVLEALARQNPDVDDYQASCAEAWMNIGQTECLQKRREAALKALEQAANRLEPLVMHNPDRARYGINYVKTLRLAGELQPDRLRRAETIKTLETLQSRLQQAAKGPNAAGPREQLPHVAAAIERLRGLVPQDR